MTLGTMALMLIRLEERQGQYVSVAELAATYGLSEELVRQALDKLWDEGYVQCQRLAQSEADVGVIEAACSVARG